MELMMSLSATGAFVSWSMYRMAFSGGTGCQLLLWCSYFLLFLFHA